MAGERTELGDGEHAHHEQLQVLSDHSLERHMPQLGCITSRAEEEAVHCLTRHSGPCADKRQTSD